jgi:hypothetical protein
MKQEILNWFRSDRQFSTGAALFNKYGRNLATKTMINRVGNTPEMFRNLCYDLAKLAGISEPQYKSMLQKPLVKATQLDKQTQQVNISDLPVGKLADQLSTIDLEKLDYPTHLALSKELDIKLKSRKKNDLFEALKEAQLKKKVVEVPASVKRSFKLRDQFPFLKRKDCPGVLKELVSDMLTDYENFVSKHEQLIDESDPVIIARLSQEVVEDYLDNRAIWKELQHYQTTGQLLGEHPIFEWMNRRSEIRAMKAPELIKLRDQLLNKIPRTRKLITDEPEHKDNAKRLERVKFFEQELTEVKLILGLDD